MRPEELQRLYEAHANPLFGFLAYRIRDRALAEDLMAETFLRAMTARRSFDGSKGSEKTWLYAIALNLLRDHLRSEEAATRALERSGSGAEADTGEGSLAAVAERDWVARALATLGGEERDLIALRYGAELTVPEIAELMGVRLTTVEGRLYRALGRLRRELT